VATEPPLEPPLEPLVWVATGWDVAALEEEPLDPDTTGLDVGAGAGEGAATGAGGGVEAAPPGGPLAAAAFLCLGLT
jgi:hypothetical protein